MVRYNVATCQFAISEPQVFWRVYNDPLALELKLQGKLIHTEHKNTWTKPLHAENTSSSDLSIGTVHLQYRRLLIYLPF